MVIPAYYTKKLSEIMLTQHRGLWYLDFFVENEKLMYHIGPRFKETFCKMFHVMKRATNDIPLDAIQRAVVSNEDRNIQLYVDDGSALAVAIMKENDHPISAALAKDLYDDLTKEQFDVRDFDQNAFRTEFAIFNKTPIQLFPGKHGAYRGGGLVHITHYNNASAKILSILEHCSSGRYAIINNRVVSLVVPTRKSAENALSEVRDAMRTIGRADRPEFHAILAESLGAARNTVASIRECMDIASRINNVGNVHRAGMIKLPRVLDHYGIASPDEKNEKWLAMNPTHADRLQLFHLLVDTVVVKDPRLFREGAGSFLFSSGDLEGTDAKRLWSKKTRVKRIKGPKIAIDDCDSEIFSDFEDDATQLDTCDDDDVVSDFGD